MIFQRLLTSNENDEQNLAENATDEIQTRLSPELISTELSNFLVTEAIFDDILHEIIKKPLKPAPIRTIQNSPLKTALKSPVLSPTSKKTLTFNEKVTYKKSK
jgi:hypothetical protein